MKPNRTQLRSLQDGSPFTVPTCPEFKYMYLLKAGDCTCKVQGYRPNPDGNFVAFEDFFSPNTEVTYDESRVAMEKFEGGLYKTDEEIDKERGWRDNLKNPLDKSVKIVDTDGVKNNKPKQRKTKMETNANTETATATVKAGRGRKRKHFVDLPKNEEFTIADVATKLGVDKFVISNEITKFKKTAPDTLEVVRTITGGKGKPAVVYKLK